MGGHPHHLVRTYRSFIEPTPVGLPRARVLLAFPALLLLVGIVLVGLGLNGTSSGVFFSQVSHGSDPDLIEGEPLATRADEWNVQTVWAIAQVEQGLPATNNTFPGGMDTTLPQDLPRIDWTVVFRPHLWGFVIMDVGHAIAFKWWLPGLAVAAAAYAFLVSVLPRRPGVAAMVATGFFFSPLFQLWYLSTTLWPVAWGLATMAALVWAFKSTAWTSRWIWSALVGYLTIVMAMGIYVPFIVPAALVVAFFGVALTVNHLLGGGGMKDTATRILPTLVAGVVASAVTGVWLFSKREVVEAFLGTAYPGERSTPTGSDSLAGFASAIASSFTQTLNAQRPGILGVNASEASTFFYWGIFLLPVVGWIIHRQVRQKQRLPWALIGLTSVVVVLLAFLYLPGWDALARLLVLDKTTANRVRLGMGIASLALFAYVVEYLDRQRMKTSYWLPAVAAGLFLVSQVGIAVLALRRAPGMLDAVQLWWLWALLSAAAIFFVGRRHVRAGAVAFLIVTVAGSALTNPVYRGVLDLRQTPVSKAVMAIDDSTPDSRETWVGVGGGLTAAVLLESGSQAYNGFQGAPSEEMWGAIDPANAYEYEWNRLAGVNWVAGAGEPQVSNPVADQIRVTFDACSEFAQEHVDFILSDDQRLDTTCLALHDRFDLPQSNHAIYEVVPARAESQVAEADRVSH
jgi:hypothetical protein